MNGKRRDPGGIIAITVLSIPLLVLAFVGYVEGIWAALAGLAAILIAILVGVVLAWLSPLLSVILLFALWLACLGLVAWGIVAAVHFLWRIT